MKVLLAGPYPPPHGGISVHVYELRKRLHMAGIAARVLNVDPRALNSHEYLRINGGLGLFAKLVRHAMRGWVLHVHINGHTAKSWAIALAGSMAGLFGRGCVVTVHSGLAPEYLAQSRGLARLACLLASRVIAVSTEIRKALPFARRADVLPAFLMPVATPAKSRTASQRIPLLACALSFRPEYGFPLLVEALVRLRNDFPDAGCVVMGGGEGRREAERLVDAQGLRDAISFLGDVSHEECLKQIAVSDVFVRPTLADGDSNSVREALALGTPVVASDVAARPEGTRVFRSGDAADLAAQIKRVCAQPKPQAENHDHGIAELIGIYEALSKNTSKDQRHGQTKPLARHAHS